MEPVLNRLHDQIKTDFEKNNRILTFDEYLGHLQNAPLKHVRSSSQYVIDMMDHFGKADGHFKLFDCEFDDPRMRIIAQHNVQNEIYSSLQNFAKEGLNNKLILLHGPNGSAKSSLISCMMTGMEHYSQSQEGALYRFNWIFPVEKVLKGGLGLASYSGTKGGIDSYAKLEETDIAAKVSCELKDHPLLLIPQKYRKELIEESFGTNKKPKHLSEYLTAGSLCHKCKMIFEALLLANKGDLKSVLKHVQIERFFISKRYRTGAVTIEPQMHVDAQSRQITLDKSLSYLPPSLQNLSLFELSGDLIEANRGMCNFSDLLKRPIDTFKYLLMTSESGSVNVGSSIAFLDTILIGSTNELQLDAFKEFPDFTSFKARIKLIRVPYLLSYKEEQKIYDINVDKIAGERHVTPHTTYVAALWAVLTRLKKPSPIHYPPNLSSIVGALTPLEKANLYDHQGMPSGLAPDEIKLLKSTINKLREEYHSVPYYEGRIGASAREIKSLLFDAAQDPDFDCLSPFGVFKALDEFVKKVMEHEFLKQDVKDGFHDCKEFISTIRKTYVSILDTEVRNSMGIFKTSQYEDYVKKYITHLSSHIKKEKIKNSITGKMEPPDKHSLEEFEKIIEAPHGSTEREAFRNNIISAIGAYSLDNPKKAVVYSEIFPDFIKKIDNHYFSEQKAQLTKLADVVRYFGTDKEDRTTDTYKLACQTIDNMIEKYSYCEHCARQGILFLIQTKY